MKIRSEWSHVAANEELARLTKGEFFVLNYLTDHGGTAFPKALSREMKVSTARIAALLKHMEIKGWVTRTADCQDNRQVIVLSQLQAGKRSRIKGRELWGMWPGCWSFWDRRMQRLFCAFRKKLSKDTGMGSNSQ